MFGLWYYHSRKTRAGQLTEILKMIVLAIAEGCFSEKYKNNEINLQNIQKF